MKHLKKFESYGNTQKYKLTHVEGVPVKYLDDNMNSGSFEFLDEDVSFELTLDTDEGTKVVEVGYDEFLNWCEDNDESMKIYLKNVEPDFVVIFREMVSLGWSLSHNLQKWVNDNISEKNIDIITDYYTKGK